MGETGLVSGEAGRSTESATICSPLSYLATEHCTLTAEFGGAGTDEEPIVG